MGRSTVPSFAFWNILTLEVQRMWLLYSNGQPRTPEVHTYRISLGLVLLPRVSR
jgi:hypothetical protein